jgi:hypothetical protein
MAQNDTILRRKEWELMVTFSFCIVFLPPHLLHPLHQPENTFLLLTLPLGVQCNREGERIVGATQPAKART